MENNGWQEVNIQYVQDRKTAKGYTIKEFSVKHRPLAEKELADLF
jgi:hypothetical protein|tara:strand:- start:341 stop:475 length:135 start_codon:yes stop_codon:yes gene_type:complete